MSEQPGYAPALCVLGLIDAALGRKDEAIREGRRAIELLPITKDSIDGAELVKLHGRNLRLVWRKRSRHRTNRSDAENPEHLKLW